MTNKIAITGIGLVDNLGDNPDYCFANYISDKKEVAVDSQFTAKKDALIKPENMRNPLWASLTDSNKMAFHAVEQCLMNNPVNTDVFTLFTTLSAGNDKSIDYANDVRDGKNTFRPKKLVQALKDFINGCIPITYDFRAGSVGFNAACATSLYQLDYAFHLVKEHDFVLCGASETGNNEWDMHFFRTLGAIGTQSKPFCETRDGFVMGEGAGCLLLEDPEKAEARGATIYGYIHKPCLTSDGNEGNVVAPSDTGITTAMKTVLQDIDPEDISFVNAHATSTTVGDDVEYYAIEKLLPDAPVMSFKSKIGHTLSASSIIEIIYTLMALRNNFVPQSHNIEQCELNNVQRECITSGGRKYALKNSLGFGGKCASVIIEKA